MAGAGAAGASLGKLHGTQLIFSRITKYLQNNDKKFIPVKQMKCKTLKNYNMDEKSGNIDGEELKYFKTLYKAYKSSYYEIYSYNGENILIAIYKTDKNERFTGGKSCDVQILKPYLNKYKAYYIKSLMLKRGFISNSLDEWISKVLSVINNKKIDDKKKYNDVLQLVK